MADDHTETIPLETVRAAVAKRVEELGSQTKAAQAWATTPQMVNMVVTGRRRPTETMLQDVGIEKFTSEISYRKKP